MDTTQIAVRIPLQLLGELDGLVERGLFTSRAAAVRAGLEILTEVARRGEVDRAIVDGYLRNPPTAADDAAALASLREAIAGEPW